MSPNQLSLRLLLLTGGAAVGWVAIATLVAPAIIERSYYEQSVPFLNSVITRPVAHSLDHYLDRWNEVSLAVLGGLLAMGLGLTTVVRPEVQHLVDARLGPPLESPATIGRRKLVYALAAMIAIGFLSDIATDREHWPFSNYPMYSRLRGRTVRPKRLFGVTDEGEIPLTADPYFQPFNESRLRRSFSRLWQAADRDRAIGRALEGALAQYETSRRAGDHDGPRLKGLRLYELQWTLEPGARNRDGPERRLLLGEANVR